MSSINVMPGEAVKPTSRPIARATFPIICAIFYPGFVDLFHAVVGNAGSPISFGGGIAAAPLLVLMFAVPLVGFLAALRGTTGSSDSAFQTRARRMAYAVITVPSLYCLIGVIQILVSSPLPDELTWIVVWALCLLWLVSGPADTNTVIAASKPAGWLRVAHGISALVVIAYVAFHLANHLFALEGQQAHASVMEAGRKVYRSSLGEPILVAAAVFQIISGLMLAWKWSAWRLDFHRTFQVASGFFLSVYLLAHMNSVFVFARAFLGIDTGWDFATGAPNGLIHDAWSARLLPHYALATFFVIGHLFSGLRVIQRKHGTNPKVADRLWLIGTCGGALLSTVIMLAMCGVRL